MKRVLASVATLALAAALPGIAFAGPSSPDTAAPAKAAAKQGDTQRHKDHVKKNPLAEKQSALREKGQQKLLRGNARPKGDNRVVKISKGQYVELAREGEDSILTVLGEFGPDTDEHAGHTHTTQDGVPGPLHNEIPEPDRSVDNSTIWEADFSEAYFEKLLYSQQRGVNSMANFYIEQSSNRYSVNGDVSPWVRVPYNAATYGSDYCGSIVCADTWYFVNDSVDAWADSFDSTADMNEELAKFDVWDRYDYDGDGNFDEPDGYIDHFQSVHAGEGGETGGGKQGTNAIWSHRWYAYFSANGPDGTGPHGFGGVRIGNSDYWIGDYTIEPENGGVGVFAHEFAHDLGLPDLYDTSGNTGGAENSTGFWTLMSSGSYGNSGRPEDGIGTKPMHMGNWEKFQLGWLKYEVARVGEKSSIRMGPAEVTTKAAQGVFALLPAKQVPLDLGDPFEGEKFYYSGSGDNLNNTMTKQVAIPAGGGALTAQVRYDIEEDWDYAYLTVNGDEVETSKSRDTNPNGTNLGEGITGTTTGWEPLTADLSSYAGQTVTLGFKYVTDGAVAEPGFMVDAIAVDGTSIGTAEADEGWTLAGFRVTTGSESQSFFNAYVLANRQYRGYDESLQTGPYNFGFLTMPDWVEHFSYQDGLLIDYWDTSYSDNNVGDHPGGGLILPVDANPGLLHWSNGTLMRPRIQSYDSTFGLERTEAYTLHNSGVPTRIPSQPATNVFDDSRTYWQNCDTHGCTGAHPGRHQPGWISVDVPDTGTRVEVVNESNHGSFMQVH
nr:immune inhibitor A [Nocardioidaceae bacterium]